ncbi:uncharacterized protein TNCV_334201 [Trichonephila clavipes]|nr:uncharacterized protein TNCV_334201 [Trichonephila clavipes]
MPCLISHLTNYQLDRDLVIVQINKVRRVVRQLGRFNCVERKCWVQWILEMLFRRSSGSGSPRQTCRQEDHHIIRNTRFQPTDSSAAIQAQVAPSLGSPVSS